MEVAPGEDLMREHGVLRRVLLVCDETIRRLEAREQEGSGQARDGAGHRGSGTVHGHMKRGAVVAQVAVLAGAAAAICSATLGGEGSGGISLRGRQVPRLRPLPRASSSSPGIEREARRSRGRAHPLTRP
jgi:hypothetical protein